MQLFGLQRGVKTDNEFLHIYAAPCYIVKVKIDNIVFGSGAHFLVIQ